MRGGRKQIARGAPIRLHFRLRYRQDFASRADLIDDHVEGLVNRPFWLPSADAINTNAPRGEHNFGRTISPGVRPRKRNLSERPDKQWTLWSKFSSEPALAARDGHPADAGDASVSDPSALDAVPETKR